MAILILGNGFDLDLGLHTRYSEFWESERWDSVKHTCPEPYLVSSLERYRITHNWFDLESGLLEGASHLINQLKKTYTSEKYEESYKMLVNELRDYILYQQNNFVPIENSVAEQILRAIDSSEAEDDIYSFNYTDINVLNDKLNISSSPQVYHVHGSLKENDHIILGIEMEDFSSIPSQLTFLIKTNNPYYRYTHLLRDLNYANDVIFFGHSINGMDFPYFKEYFQNMVSLPTQNLVEKRITIITYDEQSAMQIKDNFRRNGIDVRSLFNKVELEFIMTKAIYEGNENEIRKLEMLKNKISGGEY